MTDFLVRRFVKEYEKTDNADVRTSYGILSSIVGICCNILLFTAKLLIGAGMNSLAIMADAFNNLSDAGSSVVTLFTAMGFVSGIKKRTVVRRRPGRPLGSNAVY